MNKLNLLTMALTFMGSMHAMAENLPVKSLRVAGPFSATVTPIRTDTADVYGKAFDDDATLKQSISYQAWKGGTEMESLTVEANAAPQLYVAGFTMENTHFAKVKIKVTGGKSTQIYVDGNEGANPTLMPGRHEVAVKLLTQPDKADTLSITVETDQDKYLTLNPTGKRMYTLADYMNGEKASTTDLSATGRYMILNSYITRTDSKTEWKKELIDLKTGQTLVADNFFAWAEKGDRYISRRTGVNRETIYEYVDVATGQRTPLMTDYVGHSGSFVCNEQFMLIHKRTEGPREDAQVHQILEPDDRQAGWRNRTNVQLLDVKTGALTTLTQGQHSSWASMSDDGRKLLISVSTNDMTRRPFSFTTVLLYDCDTQQVDTLVHEDGFVGSAQFTPDARSVIFDGSPEAFNGIGKNDPTGKTPSMIQKELFIMNLATRQVKSLTYDFNPCISSWQINRADGNIYALVENKDCQDIFRINPTTGKTDKLNLSECYVKSFSLSNEKPVLSYTGQGHSNADRVYSVDLKKGKETLVRDYHEPKLGDVQLGEFHEWDYVNAKGDTISGRYYLPPHFDPSQKYPMLVYYYGGCSPTGRYLESYYNFHGWAAMGYVVYVVQPSGCTGFGQEFAARHVNTYGEGTAEDIIEGTKRFCQEHPYVNDKKIGCLGASYGGFMTQYLMTVTDIFAASMSHAGISNPTSYWGYGYWGYSYSAVSAADSYPWNNQKLLSGQAPLFNADKVHTPILFLHGASDTNVPINESIQMFTALKILGRECAFVTVEGQDHHITDYEKQKKWVSTYYAWFAKWLQDDPTWWETLYPTKNLK